MDAKGDGPLAGNLRHAPPDLTVLAKRSGGKFDADRVHRMIDGRDPIKGHGGPDMPIWGDAFKRSTEGSEREGGEGAHRCPGRALEGSPASVAAHFLR